MPWFKGDDKGRDNPKLRSIGKATLGGLYLCWLYAAGQRTNGWLPAWVVEQELTRRERDQVLTTRANGRAPLLHRYGDSCDCLNGHTWTEEMGGYWAHDWLDHNPSKAENVVHSAKRRELGDKDLRHLIKMRDGNACRYCGTVVPWADNKSPRQLTIDHVDPTLAAGADNLVIACKTCNSSKKDATTPEAAGLSLLPPPAPGTVPIDGWPKGLAPTAVVRQWPAPAPPPIDPESTTIDPTPIGPDPNRRSDRIPIADPTGDPGRAHSPAQNVDDQREHIADAPLGPTTEGVALGRGRDGSGTRTPPVPRAGDVGPAGRRPVVGPATTPRSAANPPTYRKSATSNPAPGRASP